MRNAFYIACILIAALVAVSNATTECQRDVLNDRIVCWKK